MGPLDMLIHLAGFAAPALFVALILACVAPVVMPKRPQARSWWACAAINFVVGLGVLLAGLLVFGNDGKMATYAALVVGAATSQWLAGGAWRG